MTDGKKGPAKIGISGYHLPGEDNRNGLVKGLPYQAFSMFSYDMIRSVIQAGGLPLTLPIVPEELIEHQLDTVDAIILAGGEDIHPQFYMGEGYEDYPEASIERDHYEMKLLKGALEREMPVLLICRGMQLLNVYLGGTLYIDIKQEVDRALNHWVLEERWKPVHKVMINKENFAVDALGGSEIKVNSVHHQSIDQPGDGIEVAGMSEDGVIEVVTMKGMDHILGVQWHPEMMTQHHPAALLPFQWLIGKIK